ncbi:MAG: MFS transporter [Planctomycetota bacterium]|nr:MAG: MFS transporter [Planctomycetota bacterium]
MSTAPPTATADLSATPTRMRHIVLGIAFLVAVLLYLHRFMLSYAEQFVREDLHLSDDQISWAQFAFFLAYALAQVPSGGLSDRFGSRWMLTLYILVWSGFTASMGLVAGFTGLLLVRAAVGLGQAGAYPTCAAVVRKWAPFGVRAFVSSVIALGGRVGGAIAPILVSLLIVGMVPPKTPESSLLQPGDLLNSEYVLEQLMLSQTPLVKATDEVLARQATAAIIYQQLSPQVPSLAPAVDTATRKFGDKPLPQASALSPESATALQQKLNAALNRPAWLTAEQARNLPVESEARRLWRKDSLDAAQQTRLNRLLLEAACPAGVRKVYANGWRPVMVLLGSLGLVAAGVWAWIVRDRPEQHPQANAAECDLITGGVPEDTREKSAFPWKAMLTSPSLWNLSISQLGTNIGWVFLVTLMPRYLRDVHLVPFEVRGMLASIPLWIGWFGMIAGGWATDWLTRKCGLRIGRSWPVGLSRFIGAAAFGLMLLYPPSTTGAIVLFAIVAFSTDFSSPPMWAYSQDVGGRHTAAILGWSNMWGNIGAAISPPLIDRVLGPDKNNWNGAFAIYAIAFFVAGVTGMFIDSTKKLESPGSSVA